MISVIVAVRNGMPWLEEQLQALAEQQCNEPWEVVVADNGSTDESRLVVEEWANRAHMIRLIDASKVRGPGAARNAGVRKAQGELLAFCDADDVVQPGWLAGHVLALAEAEVAAGVFDVWSLNGRVPPSPPTPVIIPDAMSQFGFLPAGGSGNLALRRHAFEDVGGFAEEMMTGEDIDLCWRLQLRGHRYVVNADAVVARRDQRGFKAVYTPVHRLRSVRPGPLPSVPSRRPPARSDRSGQDVGVVGLVHATTLAARVPYSLGQHRWMENWSSGGVAATAGVFPLTVRRRGP